MSKRRSEPKEEAVFRPEWVAIECPFCGVKGGQYVFHYDLVRCTCGKFLWALRPRRHGPLQLFPHPRLNLPSTGHTAAGRVVPADVLDAWRDQAKTLSPDQTGEVNKS